MREVGRGLVVLSNPDDEIDASLSFILEGLWPAATGSGVEDYAAFSLVFLLRKQKQKRAENKNFTSGQARILFWKREICGPFPSWPSTSLAAIEPEGDVLCTSLGGAIPGTSVGAQEALSRAGG